MLAFISVEKKRRIFLGPEHTVFRSSSPQEQPINYNLQKVESRDVVLCEHFQVTVIVVDQTEMT